MKYPYTQNRELSWLSFNERVLDKASTNTIPLMERLKFMEIFISNLDEFFMIRVGSLKNISEVNPEAIDSKTDMSVTQELNIIMEYVKNLIIKKDKIFHDLKNDLNNEGIKFLKVDELSLDDKKLVKRYFKDEVLPLLSPQILDFNHPFPHIENKIIYLTVTLEIKKESVLGLIQIPNSVPKYLEIRDNSFILMEDIIYYYLDIIFKNYKIVNRNIISITRNGDINFDEVENEYQYDFKNIMKGLIKKRSKLSPVRLECNFNLDKFQESILLKKLNLEKNNIFISDSPLKLDFVYNIFKKFNQKYFYPKLIQKENEYIDSNLKIIPQIMKHDALLFYPYESMTTFLKLIKEASIDKNVTSIKITIYRLSKKSKLVEYLCDASENGKDVTVLIELRARFDEKSNIDFAGILEDAGCHIMYGFENYKVHSKLCLITRKINNNINYITQIGTGNYNESTVNIYTDYSYITSNYEIGNDANNFFNNMLLGNLEGNYSKLLVSPNSLKNEILHLIDEEIKKKDNGYIFLKLNSITDIDVINKLVEASKNNVKIDLVIRGICCILPHIKDYTETINIKSIVGRFLEHSRIYMFGKDNPKLYISSADMMTRNTVRRVEVAVPILDKKIKNEILDNIKDILADTVNSSYLDCDGSYKEAVADNAVNCQEIFLKNTLKKEIKVNARRVLIDYFKRNNIDYEVNKVLNIENVINKKFDFYIASDDSYLAIINNDKISYQMLEKWFLLASLLKKNNSKLVLILKNKNSDIENSLNRCKINYLFLNDLV